MNPQRIEIEKIENHIDKRLSFLSRNELEKLCKKGLIFEVRILTIDISPEDSDEEVEIMRKVVNHIINGVVNEQNEQQEYPEPSEASYGYKPKFNDEQIAMCVDEEHEWSANNTVDIAETFDEIYARIEYGDEEDDEPEYPTSDGFDKREGFIGHNYFSEVTIETDDKGECVKAICDGNFDKIKTTLDIFHPEKEMFFTVDGIELILDGCEEFKFRMRTYKHNHKQRIINLFQEGFNLHGVKAPRPLEESPQQIGWDAAHKMEQIKNEMVELNLKKFNV